MTRRFIPLILLLAVMTACATPFVGHIHSTGDIEAHFDGRTFAIEGKGTVLAGFTDKAGTPFYPVTGLLKLEGDIRYALDVREKRQIPYDEAIKRLGLTKHDEPIVPVTIVPTPDP